MVVDIKVLDLVWIEALVEVILLISLGRCLNMCYQPIISLYIG